jgi:hypothetical protein
MIFVLRRDIYDFLRVFSNLDVIVMLMLKANIAIKKSVTRMNSSDQYVIQMEPLMSSFTAANANVYAKVAILELIVKIGAFIYQPLFLY